MTAALELERLVDDTLHSVILESASSLPEIQSKCAATLRALVQTIEAANVPRAVKDSYLARVRTHLALMAMEVGDHVEAEQVAGAVLQSTPPEQPDFAIAASVRVRALHHLGRHQEEVATALEHIESGSITESLLLYMLEELASRHPEMIAWKESLTSPIKAYVAHSPELADRVELACLSERDPSGYVRGVAEIARQINREMTARVLSRPPDQ